MSGWGTKFETVIDSWEGGTRTSAREDLIPPNTSPLVYNGSWERIGDGTAVIEKRPGFSLLNDGAALGSAVSGQYFYSRRNPASGVYTHNHLLFLEDGSVRLIDDTSGDLTTYGGNGFSAAITDKFVSGVTAGNFAYVVAETATTASGVAGNGLKFDGTTWTIMGINAGSAPTVGTSTAGDMTGTYDVAISYFNENTGHQSSRSPATTVTVADKSLEISWTPSSDSQVTHVNVHTRNQSISTGFYQATSIAVGTASVTLNIDNDAYNALITLAPDEDENDPVPEGTKFLTWHKSRVFAATSAFLYYSKVEFPEAFDPENYEPVNTDDGQQIMGMIPAFDNLIIFKERSFYALIGDGPNDWRIQQISSKVGLAASGSIVFTDGLLYWWANDGPVLWDGVNEPRRLGKALISESLTAENINTTRLGQIIAIEDRQNERIMWSVPGKNMSENDHIIPFKYRLGQFEGTWTGIHVASWTRGEFTDGFEWCYMGSYGGRVYRFGDSDFDGLPPGAIYSGNTGTFIPASTSITSLTLNTSTAVTMTISDNPAVSTQDDQTTRAGQSVDVQFTIVDNADAQNWIALYEINETVLGAFVDWYYLNGTKTAPGAPINSGTITFPMTGVGAGVYEFRLKFNDSHTVIGESSALTVEAFDTATGYADLHVVVIEDSTGEVIDKVEVESNTATTITLADAINGLSTSTTYRYYIGGIDFQFDTRWQDDGESLYKKRYEFIFLQLQVNKDSNVYVGLAFNWDQRNEIERVLSLTPYGASSTTIALWDVALWDVDVWVPVLPADDRLRIARAAKTWRMRLAHTSPGVEFSLYKVGIRGEFLTIKR